MYAGDGFGVVATVNGGATWRRADAGVVASRVVTVAPAASNPATIYTGTVPTINAGGSVLSRSDDRGRTWIGLRINGTGAAAWRQTDLRSLAVDPRDHRHVLVGGRGIFGSRDGGATWTSLLRLPNDQVWHIAFARSDPGQVYAAVYTTATEQNMLFRSSDGGKTWSVEPGSGSQSLTVFAVHPMRADTVYAGYDRGEPTEGLTSTGGGVASSSDGGRSWRHRSIPDVQSVSALAVAPTDPDTIYAATDVGLARSVDGGDHWRLVPNPELFLRTVVVDPERSETVYVVTWDQRRGVPRSTNGGGTWRPFGARLPRRGVEDLAFDPSGNWLYAGLSDGGLTSIRVR